MMKKIVLVICLLVFLSPLSYSEEGYNVTNLKADIQVITRGDLGLADSIWMELINMGIQNLASLADCAVDTQTVYLSSGTFEYALPSNFQKLWHAINRGTQRVYDNILPEDRGKGGTGLEVEEYKVYTIASTFIKGIGFYPTPTATDSVLVYYFKTPEIVDANADTVDIAEPFHPALKYSCLIELWERIERWDKANLADAKLINKINNVRGRLLRPPDVVVGTREVPRD